MRYLDDKWKERTQGGLSRESWQWLNKLRAWEGMDSIRGEFLWTCHYLSMAGKLEPTGMEIASIQPSLNWNFQGTEIEWKLGKHLKYLGRTSEKIYNWRKGSKRNDTIVAIEWCRSYHGETFWIKERWQQHKVWRLDRNRGKEKKGMDFWYGRAPHAAPKH